MYRDRLKGVQTLLSNSQAGPGRAVKQEQEEISPNPVQAFIPGSVYSPFGCLLFPSISIPNSWGVGTKKLETKKLED